MNKSLVVLLFIVSLLGCTGQTKSDSDGVEWPAEDAKVRIVPVSYIQWEALNPARGDMSPRAGTLWGDRQAEVPTGFLAAFVDGFSSPPHIHNATYRAVVIDGAIHNDDPSAEKMWMAPGSYWTQPKGEVHITAARGTNNIALVEIDRGPYLVMPVPEAFDSGERPVNIDASNIVWLPLADQSDVKRDPSISYLWGHFNQGEWNGSFIKLPPGFSGTLNASGSVFHCVVIQGKVLYGGGGEKDLEPGSYVGAEGASSHALRAGAEKEAILYIRTNGLYELL